MKIFYGILMLISISFSAQTKQELDKVMLSKDPFDLNYFIKKYPQDSNVPFLKRKLETLREKPNTPTISAIPPSTPAVKSTVFSAKSSGTSVATKPSTDMSPKKKNTEAVLNHLFNNDPTNNEAYVQIKNQSECDIRVKIEGKKAYYMDVPKMGDNYILVPKGYYNISTDICNAQYSSTKNVNQDMQIKLLASKKARN